MDFSTTLATLGVKDIGRLFVASTFSSTLKIGLTTIFLRYGNKRSVNILFVNIASGLVIALLYYNKFE